MEEKEKYKFCYVKPESEADKKYHWHVGLAVYKPGESDDDASTSEDFRRRINLTLTENELWLPDSDLAVIQHHFDKSEKRLLLVNGVDALDAAMTLYYSIGCLPADCIRHIITSLIVPPVDMEQVTAVACSSISDSNPFYKFCKEGTLEESLDSCWISASGTCVDGRGNEWILYQLGPSVEDLRRVRFVTLKIPVPPHGPLAVKKFHLAVLKEGEWVRVTPEYELLRTHPVEESNSLQMFAIDPPIEASQIKLMCTQNFLGERYPEYDAIGFWQIIFR